VKIDGRAVMGTVAKSASHPFDLFDLGVDRLSQSIGDSVTGIGNYIVHIRLECLGRFLDQLKPRMGRPKIPALEVVADMRLIAIIP